MRGLTLAGGVYNGDGVGDAVDRASLDIGGNWRTEADMLLVASSAQVDVKDVLWREGWLALGIVVPLDGDHGLGDPLAVAPGVNGVDVCSGQGGQGTEDGQRGNRFHY